MLPENTKKSNWSSFLLTGHLETVPNFGKIRHINLEINFEAADGWDWLDDQPDSVYYTFLILIFTLQGLTSNWWPELYRTLLKNRLYFCNYGTGYWT